MTCYPTQQTREYESVALESSQDLGDYGNLDKLPEKISSLVREIITSSLSGLVGDGSCTEKRENLQKNVDSFVVSYLSTIEQTNQSFAIEKVALKTLLRFKKGIEKGFITAWFDNESSFPSTVFDKPCVLKRCSISDKQRISVLKKWGEGLKEFLKLEDWPKSSSSEIEKRNEIVEVNETFCFPMETGIPSISLRLSRFFCPCININGNIFELKVRRANKIREFLYYILNGDEIKITYQELMQASKAFPQTFWAGNWREDPDHNKIYEHIDKKICEYFSQLIASGQLSLNREDSCVLELFAGKGDLAKKLLDLFPNMQYIFSEFDPVSTGQAMDKLVGKCVTFTPPTDATKADYETILKGKTPLVVIISGGLTQCVLNDKKEAMTVLSKLYPFMACGSKIILTGLADPLITPEDLKTLGFRLLNLSHSSTDTLYGRDYVSSFPYRTWFYVAEKMS